MAGEAVAAAKAQSMGPPTTGSNRAASSSISLVPQNPHDEVEVANRGVGAGALVAPQHTVEMVGQRLPSK